MITVRSVVTNFLVWIFCSTFVCFCSICVQVWHFVSVLWGFCSLGLFVQPFFSCVFVYFYFFNVCIKDFPFSKEKSGPTLTTIMQLEVESQP